MKNMFNDDFKAGVQAKTKQERPVSHYIKRMFENGEI